MQTHNRPVYISQSPLKPPGAASLAAAAPVAPVAPAPIGATPGAVPANPYQQQASAAAQPVYTSYATTPYASSPAAAVAPAAGGAAQTPPSYSTGPGPAGGGSGYTPGGGGDTRFTSVGRTGSSSSGSRIVPDGFHSSSNDPALQKRYGHQIAAKNLPPPPIFGGGGGGGAASAGPPAMAGVGGAQGPPAMGGGAALAAAVPMHSYGSGGSLASYGSGGNLPSLATHRPPAAAPAPPVVVPAMAPAAAPTAAVAPPVVVPAMAASKFAPPIQQQPQGGAELKEEIVEVDLTSSSSSVM